MIIVQINNENSKFNSNNPMTLILIMIFTTLIEHAIAFVNENAVKSIYNICYELEISSS